MSFCSFTRGEKYRDHFEVDEAGNYVQGEASAEAEAAWSEYYETEGGDPAAAPADPTAVAEAPPVEEAAPAPSDAESPETTD